MFADKCIFVNVRLTYVVHFCHNVGAHLPKNVSFHVFVGGEVRS